MATTSLTQRWVAQRLPPRSPRAHKGQFGRVLVVAGSLEFPGAALLAGLGAMRAGAGLTCLALPEALATQLLGRTPELTGMVLVEEAPGLIAPAGWRRLSTEAPAYDALVIGPGLGRQPSTLRRTRSFIAELRRPAVVDADALTALAEGGRWWSAVKAPLVLTPHPGEFARMMGRNAEVLPNDDELRVEAARTAAERWGVVVVLKGPHSVVAAPGGELLRSTIATPALATAGTGDVLAGVIAAFLAAGLAPLDAAGCGVAVHGAAGLVAEDRIGTAGVIASDVAGLVPEAMESLRGGRRS